MAVQQTEDEHAPVLTVTEARGASRGRHIAWVLGISMALVIVGMGGLWFARAPSLSGAGGQTSQTVEYPHAGAPQPKSAPALTPGVGAQN